MLEVIEAAVLAQLEHEKAKKVERAKVEAAETHANPLFSEGAKFVRGPPDEGPDDQPKQQGPSSKGRQWKGNKVAPKVRPNAEEAVFSEGDDWKVQFDYETEGRDHVPFPAEIAIVSGEGSRPDGVMWSMETKTVVWIELTSPWEENSKKNHDLKKARYNSLAIDLREGKHVGGIKWRVIPLCVEVGCRGTVNEGPWYGMCRRLGFTKTITRRVTNAAKETAVWCSYHIFLCRFMKVWEKKALMGATVWNGAH